jgi:hypothetical protein
MARALELFRADFEAHKRGALIAFPEFFEASFVVDFGMNPSAFEPLHQRLRFGALAVDGDRQPIHTAMSDDLAENQELFGIVTLL